MIINENIDNRILLNDILKRNYYKDFQSLDSKKCIEIFLFGPCKSNCDYCYLKKHQKELFPIELNNYDNIIQNFEIFLNWYIENNFRCNLDIFSGEWITTPLFEPIFNLMYEKFSSIPMIKRPKNIIMADNGQFIKNKQIEEKLQKYIDIFEKELHIRIFISISIDGKYCDYDRVENDDEFYKNLFDFMQRNHYAAHPMISSDNVKYWIKNYQWWINTAPKEISSSLMTLEVRDETWTEESISQLLQYCDFFVDYHYKNTFNENKNNFFNWVFNIDSETCDYNTIQILLNGMFEGRDTINCHFSKDCFCLRIADLTLGMCHRQFYPELIIGKFNVQNNKIIDMDEINVSLLILKDNIKRSCLPHCENCNFVGICTGFCAGNSYENYKNSLVPTKEVCDMYIAKNSFLLYKYYTLGLLDWLKTSKINKNEQNYLDNLITYIVNKIEGKNNE